MSNTKTIMGQASNQYVALPNVEDVFSTYLYEGNGSTQTITNGIDLDGEGGLVWIKDRDNSGYIHNIYDTERGLSGGFGLRLQTNATSAEAVTTGTISSFNGNGFSLGDNAFVNNSGSSIASWTFRKAPKFFTCLTYSGTGPGSAANEQQVSHDLGVKPGIVIIKRTDATGDWWVFTDVIDGSNDYAYLNQSAAFGNSANNVATDSVFNVGGSLNTSGATYVAYLFASNDGDGGFNGGDIIKCGSYTGNGSTDGPEIDLGFEPQWVMIKKSSDSENWYIYDSMRGVITGPHENGLDKKLYANSDISERGLNGGDPINFGASGFNIGTADNEINGSGGTYIYMAIRRGTKVPESGTEVFAMDTLGSTTPNPPSYNAGFPVDLGIMKSKTSGTDFWRVGARLTGETRLKTNSTEAEATDTQHKFDYQDGWYDAGSYVDSQYQSWMWKRAPNYFDVVAYTGNGTAGRTVSHNLGVAPEFYIIKSRTATGGSSGWLAFHHEGFNGSWGFRRLDNTDPFLNVTSFPTYFPQAPAEDTFYVGTQSDVNQSGIPYIAYLFASLPGISKVGSFTATGSVLDIDCGFTSGARFVLIKRTDSTGDWFVFDSVRGITASTSPYLYLNSTSDESVANYIDPLSSGFRVTTNFYGSGDFIFYAIA